jgi:hypothetical protein
MVLLTVQGHQLAHKGGAAWSLPLLKGGNSEMDAKSLRGLVWLTLLSLLCAIVAWTVDHVVFGSVFVALSAVAVFGAAAPRHWR